MEWNEKIQFEKEFSRRQQTCFFLMCLLASVAVSPNCLAQKKTQNTAPADKYIPPVAHTKANIGSDFGTAIQITGLSYGPTVAPQGPGKSNEFKSAPGNLYAFEKEHNSAWYLFTARYTGELTFEIVPEKPDDDYDFLLFKCDSADMKTAFEKHALKPLRSNLAHNNHLGKGCTGLSSAAQKEFVAQGSGDPFSKSVSVKYGEKYCLVLDNVT